MERKLAISLLSLRIGVFVVMFMWTLDKFINPAHTGKVFAKFYGLEGLGGEALTVLACLQLVIVLAFAAGALRRSMEDSGARGATLVPQRLSSSGCGRRTNPSFRSG